MTERNEIKYLLVSIINAIYGVLLLLTLSSDTPGYFIVLTIGLVLTILGLAGFILWIRMVVLSAKDEVPDDTAIKNWFGLVKSFDIVLIIGLFFRALIIQPFVVDGVSMEPNFHNKEALLVDKITYRFREPQKGEVIIFQAPEKPREDYIKRIIATPGETVIVTRGKVFINGYLLEEPYLSNGAQTQTSESVFRKTLKPNEYFVMGDNRSNSSDSREWGAVPKVNIVGRAVIAIYPFNQRGIIKVEPPIIDTNTLLKNYTSFLEPLFFKEKSLML
ncbi:signal peptidase I [Candidatus Berkelbacteria bacterium RBG_13_40_8]|uniref:Signal peptidase I n=1 Tax=Candidatus Berkelbacteria bacterium RBG_13_40_8 TaxID=1797467 RepID=A0A1F5DML7_9BACT|nr:MAG: signal peptidase I [Candidatus Berkelbacteria bacterium RBG_13_40_8]